MFSSIYDFSGKEAVHKQMQQNPDSIQFLIERWQKNISTQQMSGHPDIQQDNI